jgi:hypothetical protein
MTVKRTYFSLLTAIENSWNSGALSSKRCVASARMTATHLVCQHRRGFASGDEGALDSPNRAVCLSPLATVWFSLSGPVPLSAHCPSLIAYNLHLTWCTVSSSSSPVTSSFFSVKTGLDASRSSGSPTLRPSWLLPLAAVAAVVGAGEADPACWPPSESVAV